MVSFFGGAVVPLTPGRTILNELFILTLHSHSCHALHALILVAPCNDQLEGSQHHRGQDVAQMLPLLRAMVSHCIT